MMTLSAVTINRLCRMASKPLKNRSEVSFFTGLDYQIDRTGLFLTRVFNTFQSMVKSPDAFTLLLVDDDPRALAALKRLFHKDVYRLLAAGSGPEALVLLQTAAADAALIDYQLPGMNGLELLDQLLRIDPRMQIIVLTGQGNIETAVAAMKAGAVDFLEKPFQPEALRARITQLVNIWRLRSENSRLKSQGETQLGLQSLIGKASALQIVKEMIARAALLDATVLIDGETGTGKELLARAIHHQSPRSTQPGVPDGNQSSDPAGTYPQGSHHH